MLPQRVVKLKVNIIKYALAKARRIKRTRKINSSLKKIKKKKIIECSNLIHYGQDKLVIIASTTQGNERISKIDYKLKLMLDRLNINNKIIFSAGGLTACSMREEEKGDQEVMVEPERLNYACISCNINKDLKREESRLIDKQEVLHIDYTKAYANAEKKLTHEDLTGNYKGINVHEHARSSTIRYLGRPLKAGEEKKDCHIKAIYYEYWKSGCAVVDQWEQLIAKEKPSHIVINHGLYIPQGIILEISKKFKIPVSTWHLGYRKNTLLIAHGDTYHKTLIEPLDAHYLDEPLTSDQQEELNSYMSTRRTGKEDQISFVYKKGKSRQVLLEVLKRKTKDKVNFLVPTNVSWDAQSHFQRNTYRSMEEWVDEIIDLAKFYENTANFIFRCHPAEVTGKRKSRYSSSNYILKKANSSNNIFVVKPDQLISTYDLIDYCDAGIIYASKVGIEIAYAGKELIVCGEACIKSKEIAREVYQKDDLKHHIDEILEGKKKMNRLKAAKYAHHIFFNVMIDWKNIEDPSDYSDDVAVFNRLMHSSLES